MSLNLINDNDLFCRNCLAFSLGGTVVRLVDDRGCENKNFLSQWSYDQSSGMQHLQHATHKNEFSPRILSKLILSGLAEATLYSLRRLAQSNRTFYQCDMQLCQGECQLPDCDGGAAVGQSRGQPQIFVDTITGSTTVFVADPNLGSEGALGVSCKAGDDNPSWLRGTVYVLFSQL